MSPNETDRDSLMPMPWLAVPLAVVAVVGILQAVMLPLNGDASWYLYMAGRVLDGARPYEQIVDTNPPLILGIDMALVAVARGIRCDPLTVFAVAVFLLIVASLGLSWHLSRGLPTALRQVGLVTWAYLLLVSAGAAFGQREHLLMILILPYAHGALGEASGERSVAWEAVLTGLMAGIGFALKPFFLPAAAAVELFVATRRGPCSFRRPQALAMIGVFLVYAVATVIWTPAYFAAARRFAPLYPHHQPLGPVLWSSSWRMFVVVVAIAIAWSEARRRVPEWAGVFGLLAIELTAAVYSTGKGWRYHWLPAVSLAAALMGGTAAIVVARLPIRRRWGALGLVTIVPCLATVSLADRLSSHATDAGAARLVRDLAGGGKPVLILSCWVHRSFPMVIEAGASWGMRHPMLWQIAAFYDDGSWRPNRYHELDAMSGPERRFVGEIAEDFAHARPEVLLIDDDPPTPSLSGFDYLNYLSREPRFAQALTDYDYAGRTRYFRVYTRRPADRQPSSFARSTLAGPLMTVP